MGDRIELQASDGFTLGAYRAEPLGKAVGAVVVVQEVFGVNDHIRCVVDRFAGEGYLAIAPALFDRVEPGIELGYTPADVQRGIALKAASDTAKALMDIDAARNAVAATGRVGIIGFCWGGYLSWHSATRLDGFRAAAVYYGGGIGSVAAEQPRCPVIMHFGERDTHIPPSDIQAVRDAHQTGVEIHLYPADHGFNCDQRGSYDAASAVTARERTLAFFKAHLAG